MTISLKTHKMLWGRAANRCAYPNCRQELVMSEYETDDETLIGEECHIVAREQNGPRGNSSLSNTERDKYNNLILLCRIHHKLIDDQPDTYSPSFLKDMKLQHEMWVREKLQGFDRFKQKDDEIYASLIEDWLKYSNLNNWEVLSFNILGGSGLPKIPLDQLEKLDQLTDWLFRRIWPNRYPELNAAFENFSDILRDFCKMFNDNGEIWNETIRIPKVKLSEWNPTLYKQLDDERSFRVKLIEDLWLELTRAANYICDKIRQFIDPAFRLKEGLVTAALGATEDDPFALYHILRTQYQGTERSIHPYPGLEQYKIDRQSRDCNTQS